jgi:thiosulfate/3-mercaptopyruvate sulfurtransferase
MPTKIDRAHYAHPEVLVDAKWVAAHLDDPAVRIIDAREPLEGTLYETGHIPGAIYVSVFSDVCCPSKIMDAEQFDQLMGELGIGDDTTVVVYDTDGGLWASRLWWALKYYGHDDVKMLNGGLITWLQAGQPLEAETPEVAPAVFQADVQPHWLATMDEVTEAIEDPEVFLLDALTRPNYVGDIHEYARPGHIATALSFPAPDTLDPVFRTVLSPEDLSRMLTRLGLDPEKRVITYCGGGIYGAHTAFVLYLMGFDKVGLYDGSLLEWAGDSANPMEVEPIAF